MKIFKSQWFGGNGDKSMAEAYELHKMLDEALTALSGIQQPPRPCSEESEYAEKYDDDEVAAGEADVVQKAKSIYTALTGRVIVKDKAAKN